MHPRHGIGTVKSFAEKEFAGLKARMAVLFFPRGELKVMVPEKQLDHTVRAPIGEDQARNVIEFIKSWDGKLSGKWKVRRKKNQERLESGDPFAVCEVFKGLRQILARKGKLNSHDRRQLAAAHDILLGELSHALPEAEEIVEARMETASAA